MVLDYTHLSTILFNHTTLKRTPYLYNSTYVANFTVYFFGKII
ncbi:hypothetical protein EGX64_02610 [Staphylococcus epidermidis]|nr:hypothetical protein BUM85_00580 [Staphylococcus epidermidis]EES35129.1 hypothetical protein HMPREF0791_2244 [Staphylococcus epidermidis W23144]ASJ94847.1 hypothetical protein CFE88_11745 [Staphylococcus epidermidis]AYY61467.1 hypothetical protein EGX64_02610 [Staphylococcus epidermidis]KAA9392198.1 hypothetical protein F6I16_03345 [Staphylococcus epidermidis]